MSELFSLRMPPEILSITIGEHQALIIDDFLSDPTRMVEAAAKSTFSDYPAYASRKGYPGIRAQAPDEYSLNMTGLIEPLIKSNFEVPTNAAMRKSICAFSLTTMPASELGPLQRTPHFDSSSPHHFAVLLYLCDARHGGTGFYRHNTTGLQQITESTREHYLDVYYEEINAKLPAQRYFDDSTDQFAFLGMIPAKFNRLVVYRGSLLHTACVHPDLSVDANPQSGRLTVNSFFDF